MNQTMYKCKVAEMYAKMKWCEDFFGASEVTKRWYRRRGYLVFRQRQDYIWFKLRWSGDSKILEWHE